MCAGHLAPIGSATNYHPDGFCNLDQRSLEGKVLLVHTLPPQMHTPTSEPIINNAKFSTSIADQQNILEASC